MSTGDGGADSSSSLTLPPPPPAAHVSINVFPASHLEHLPVFVLFYFRPTCLQQPSCFGCLQDTANCTSGALRVWRLPAAAPALGPLLSTVAVNQRASPMPRACLPPFPSDIASCLGTAGDLQNIRHHCLFCTSAPRSPPPNLYHHFHFPLVKSHSRLRRLLASPPRLQTRRHSSFDFDWRHSTLPSRSSSRLSVCRDSIPAHFPLPSSISSLVLFRRHMSPLHSKVCLLLLPANPFTSLSPSCNTNTSTTPIAAAPLCPAHPPHHHLLLVLSYLLRHDSLVCPDTTPAHQLLRFDSLRLHMARH
ncbi:hypothetical protein F5X68DRAFT_5767 [Plectosphaerella plurivora]|uniref:Uncharacterized protein n=1 Tax=Plectosphaerella plurivora TaxID=936078 RepID=A0A9P8VNQ0_9PEZI|nr:hypothetical protein F5X68DRAFT_5767 [Plectosphaerella plurivora]